MPFDVLPQETKVGQFQHFADAMLRGCAVTKPLTESYAHDNSACAIGAMWIGMGYKPGRSSCVKWDVKTRDVQQAYYVRYGRAIQEDNDSGTFTREQIAARIAAL